ncbi:UDP-N-acetylmuramate--L-alanine ligase [Candidatus Wolfebacteria bacterium]|nr:UDP-N-acetylmuramate--L-alanine ligase [Candidatus Wolfebacteria bacterium]
MKGDNVHFIGIGGIGVSALARWFLSKNYKVSGSDIEPSSLTRELKKEGVKIFISHSPANIRQTLDLVIHTSALPKNNSEIIKARKLGTPIKSYSETIGDLTKKYKTIAVAGAHGKSTSTALISLILIKAGFDPTVIIGTKLREFGGKNFRKGKSDFLIMEADEHNAAFVKYHPYALMITNIDLEHLDFYKNLKNIKNTFLEFVKNIQTGGIIVLNQDDKNLLSLKAEIQKIVLKNKLKVFWYGFRVFPRLIPRVSALLKIPGEHNVSNAMGVYTLAKALGIKDKPIFDVLPAYRGSWRRMEYRGQLKIENCKLKIDIYDDYAHHPTEIKATLSGIRQKWPKSGLICVFQPHQAKRLTALFKEFVGAFEAADILILLDIYKVAGRDRLPAVNHAEPSQKVTSQKLAEVINKRINSKLEIRNLKLREAVYLPSPRNLRQIIKEKIDDSPSKADPPLAERFSASGGKIHNSWIIVMMGAGDIYKMTDKLIKS